MKEAHLRESNIEILRILSMVMILCVHFDGAALGLENPMTLANIGNLGVVSRQLVESITIIGVNCFVLISGYFGIKVTVKGLVNFLMCCLFYSIGIYGLKMIAKPDTITLNNIWQSVAILTKTDLWFVPAYFVLYILSPMINNGLERFSNKIFTIFLIGLVFINIYLGWMVGGNVNPTGYNAMQMIFIYVIGRYIARYNEELSNCRFRKYYILAFVTSVMLIFMSTFLMSSREAFAYNSPFVVLSAVSFFLIFTTFKLFSVKINYIATSVFAVYLIHKMPPVWGELRHLVVYMSNNYQVFVFALLWIALLILVFAVCIMIDKVRLAMMTPIQNWVADKIGHAIEK